MRIALAAIAAAAVLAAPAAAAPRADYAIVNSYIPARIDGMIGFIPSHGMNPADRPPRITNVRLGGKTFRFFYQNSAVVWPSSDLILRTLGDKYASTSRAASSTAASPRRSAGASRCASTSAATPTCSPWPTDHPACAAGLTAAQARGIARGTITRWSQVVSLPAGAPDAIAVRVERTSTGAKVPRWGSAASASTPRAPAPRRTAASAGRRAATRPSPR